MIIVKDIHREKALSNKAPAFTNSMNVDICVVGSSKQLIIIGAHTESIK